MASSSVHALKQIQAYCCVVALLAPTSFAHAASEKVVYSFKGSPDGGTPQAGLTYVDGMLYGTTSVYGANGYYGTVFKVTTAGDETVLHSFGGGSDGGVPDTRLINVRGTLYGTTNYYGSSAFCSIAYGCGTVFTLTTAGQYATLHTFDGSDGGSPQAGLIDVGGTLYGTTYGGGAFGNGTVFKLTKGGAETVVYSFKGQSDGGNPSARLIDVGGALYGTTYRGAAYGYGTAFKVTLDGIETVLHTFRGGKDGGFPDGRLINVGGLLYGTTQQGGARNDGTIFTLTTAGVERVIYSFKGGRDGANPKAGLTNSDATLYGTTLTGGGSGCGGGGCGTVFKVSNGGVETVLYSFKGGSDGWFPFAGVIKLGGSLYGTTSAGGGSGCGGNGCGTVFEVTP
jgi:uncharacterized repeat protein (TIGR03803 family)